MMKSSEIQTNYFKETKSECIDNLGYFTDDYVNWLQGQTATLKEQLEAANEKVKSMMLACTGNKQRTILQLQSEKKALQQDYSDLQTVNINYKHELEALKKLKL